MTLDAEWIILGVLVAVQIIEILRSSRAHKAEIDAKNALIEQLREQTSPQAREYLLSVKADLEQSNDELRKRIDRLVEYIQADLSRREAQLAEQEKESREWMARVMRETQATDRNIRQLLDRGASDSEEK